MSIETTTARPAAPRAAGAPPVPAGRAARPAPWIAALTDLGSLVLLALVAVQVYFSRVRSAHVTNDAMVKIYLLFEHALPAVIIDYQPHLYRFFGRPLRGLPWNMADLAGGSVAAYTAFLYGCVLTSAVLAYLLGRLLFPRHAMWAFAAAALKLVWTADLDVYGNNTLTNHFGETAFWLAACLLVVSIRWGPRLSRLARCGLHLTLALAVIAGMGGYEMGWLVVLFVPIPLLHALRSHRPARPFWPLLSWYLACAISIGWWLLNIYRYPRLSPSGLSLVPHGWELVTVVAQRTLVDVKISLVDAVVEPLRQAVQAQGSGADVPQIVLLTVGVTALCIWMHQLDVRRRAGADPGPPASVQAISAAGWLVLYGLAIMVLGVLLTTVRFEAAYNYGSRLLQYGALGAILVVIAPAVWLTTRSSGTGSLVAVLYVAILFWSSLTSKSIEGFERTKYGPGENDFWRQLSQTIPSVAEGTVVVVENDPYRPGHSNDSYSTFVFRALTDTRETILITQHNPKFVRKDGRAQIRVTSDVVLDVPHDALGHLSVPAPNPTEREVTLDPDRVLWLHWRSKSQQLEIDYSRSNLARLVTDGYSAFGHQLYPDE
jgi:hypothetical protein